MLSYPSHAAANVMAETRSSIAEGLLTEAKMLGQETSPN
jgi:hypothetical protein